MAVGALKWDQENERLYETGVQKGVLFVYDSENKKYGAGEAWNGLTAVTESPSGAEPTKLYANDSVYLTLMSAEELGLTIEAYMYPDGFAKCNGEAQVIKGMNLGQQARSKFGLCYRTAVGNDTLGNDYSYKLHFVYGCLASPSEKAYNTVNDDPEVDPMSWEVSTTPVPVTIEIDGEKKEFKPTASITINAADFKDEAKAANLKALEDAIYGTASAESYLPSPEGIYSLLDTGTDSTIEAE